eukprot:scaffold151508_cov29-Tisochrysis_lutea.AAC.7
MLSRSFCSTPWRVLLIGAPRSSGRSPVTQEPPATPVSFRGDELEAGRGARVVKPIGGVGLGPSPCASCANGPSPIPETKLWDGVGDFAVPFASFECLPRTPLTGERRPAPWSPWSSPSCPHRSP